MQTLSQNRLAPKAFPSFSRTPRDYVHFPDGTVELRMPPSMPSAPSNSLLNYILPLAGLVVSGIIGIIALGSGQILYFIIMLPMMLFSVMGGIYEYFRDKSKFKTEIKQKHQSYTQYLAEVQRQITIFQDDQRRASLEVHPDIKECLYRVQTMNKRLWERTPTDKDFLELRVGSGAAPICFQIKSELSPSIEMQTDPLYINAKTVLANAYYSPNAAITVPLLKVGWLGICGQPDITTQNTIALILQLATHHSPQNVKIVTLYPESEMNNWHWMRWLPHTWDQERTQRYISSSIDSHRELLLSIIETIKKQTKPDLGKEDKTASPNDEVFVIFIADSRIINGDSAAPFSPLLDFLQSSACSKKVFSIILVHQQEQLPSTCKATIKLSHLGGLLTLIGPPKLENTFRPDLPNSSFAEEFARSQAPIRLKSSSKAAELRSSISLLQLLGVSQIENIEAEKLWSQSEPFSSLAAPIGIRVDNEPLIFDLHEKAHGPHGLVAGATGAGKSELLQTMITSLSIHCHPQEMAFILIDYKGGGMANAFRTLPHQIGIITNLEGNQSLRALAAIRSELKRRQLVFDQAGVNNIDHYLRLRRNNPQMEPLPHLAIIADEFAELVQNQPEFMKELISAVRVGRSLGIHLILATQKPSGVVNDQIWGNTRFRLCLRVEQPEDSKEMLKRPDAAMLRRPGQSYFQVGMDEVFELFQTAFSGAPYSPNDRGLVGFRDLALVELNGKRLRLTPTQKKEKPSLPGQTQLSAVVEYLHQLAQTNNIKPVKGPWLPPLAEAIYLAEIRDKSCGWNGKTWVPQNKISAEQWLNPSIGIFDDPNHQTQAALKLPIGKEGHLLIYGAPGTGKTVFIQTLITSIIHEHSPNEVQLYLFDFGSRILKAFEDLPHVGAVIFFEDSERWRRTLKFLEREVETRKTLLSTYGAANLLSFRESNPQETPADIILIIDNYIELAKSEEYDYLDIIDRLARQAGNYGIHLILSAGAANSVSYTLGGNFSLAVTFEQIESGDYANIVGRTDGLVPEKGVKGRGLIRATPPLEFQCALPVQGDTDQQKTANLKALVAEMRTQWKGTSAFQMRTLPTELALSELLSSLPSWAVGEKICVPIGLDSDMVEPFNICLEDGPHFLISGAMQGGKTTLILTWLLGLAENIPPQQLHINIFALDNDSLYSIKGLPHVKAYCETMESVAAQMQIIEDTLSSRKKLFESYLESRKTDIEAQNPLVNEPALLLVIDDYNQFEDSGGESINEQLCQFYKVRLGKFHLIIGGAGSSFEYTSNPFIKSLLQGKTGFIVGTNEFDFMEIKPSRSVAMPPGRAYFKRPRQAQKIIQIASPSFAEGDINQWVHQICAKGGVHDTGKS